MGKFSSFKEDQLLFENWRKYTNVRKPQSKKIIKEDIEVVLTNEEAGEMFGEDIEKQLDETEDLPPPQRDDKTLDFANWFLDGVPHYQRDEETEAKITELSSILGKIGPELEKFVESLPEREQPEQDEFAIEEEMENQPDSDAMEAIAKINSLPDDIQAQVRAALLTKA